MNDQNSYDTGAHHKIIMCMGSACFTRGNKRSVEIVKEYLENHGLAAEVVFRGCLCSNRCKAAPVIIIDEHPFEKVLPQAVTELLDHVFKEGKSKNESA
ncbi:MAG: (2Fe-2S) ferredoxin domain-containing protein [Candidatus Riflebacteria bacterium]|nr:(2Fe-2S) ferredoxin domain-containing protein [Candidatus Riflebacteria bacterium]